MSEKTGKIEKTAKEAEASKEPNEELTAEDLEQAAGGAVKTPKPSLKKEVL